MTGEKFKSDYLPLQEDLYRVAYYILESSSDAEDAVQDLYLRLWSAADALDPINNPKAYCIRLLRNICIDRLRTKKPQGGDCLPEIAAGDALPDERLGERQQIEAIVKRMSTLSDNERTVLKMKVFDNLDYEEIRKLTGLSHISVRVHLSNARRKIRKIKDTI